MFASLAEEFYNPRSQQHQQQQQQQHQKQQRHHRHKITPIQQDEEESELTSPPTDQMTSAATTTACAEDYSLSETTDDEQSSATNSPHNVGISNEIEKHRQLQTLQTQNNELMSVLIKIPNNNNNNNSQATTDNYNKESADSVNTDKAAAYDNDSDSANAAYQGSAGNNAAPVTHEAQQEDDRHDDDDNNNNNNNNQNHNQNQHNDNTTTSTTTTTNTNTKTITQSTDQDNSQLSKNPTDVAGSVSQQSGHRSTQRSSSEPGLSPRAHEVPGFREAASRRMSVPFPSKPLAVENDHGPSASSPSSMYNDARGSISSTLSALPEHTEHNGKHKQSIISKLWSRVSAWQEDKRINKLQHCMINTLAYVSEVPGYLEEEGIFRKNGVRSKVKALQKVIVQKNKQIPYFEDIHTVCGALKACFMEYEAMDEHKRQKASQQQDPGTSGVDSSGSGLIDGIPRLKDDAWNAYFGSLPPAQQNLFEMTTLLLALIHSERAENKMDCVALARGAPCLSFALQRQPTETLAKGLPEVKFSKIGNEKRPSERNMITLQYNRTQHNAKIPLERWQYIIETYLRFRLVRRGETLEPNVDVLEFEKILL